MKRMRRGVALAALFLAAAPSLYSFDLEDALELLQDRALVLNIVARVTNDGREAIWNMELTEVTISGRAVEVELDGGDLILKVQFTPYERGDSLVLVAQGQAWLGASNDEVTYRSAYESIPVSPGESVVFFPLGNAAVGGSDDNLLNVELEIKIEPYHVRAE